MSRPEVRQRRATFEDLLAIPDHVVAEIVNGELHTSPRPAPRHARAEGRLFSRLSRAFDEGEDGPGGWWIVIEPEIHLGSDALVPDIGGWRRERVPVFPETAAWQIAPDWICEVISPSTGRLDRLHKLPAYARHNVQHAWIVDPIQRTLEGFRLNGESWTLVGIHGVDETVRAEPFDAIEIPLASLWIPDPPPPPA
jgi:Uma2 family endonuclease